MRTSKPVLLLAIAALLASALVSVVVGPAQASGGYVVTAAVSTVNAEVGKPLAFHGRVSPRAKGKKVALQVLQPGATSWATLKTAKLTRASKYSITIVPTLAGATRYRVVKAAGSGHGGGVSSQLAVTTWRWRSFASLPVAAALPNSGSLSSAASVTLAGITFAPALIQTPNGGSADTFFDLDGRCSRLDSWVSGDPTSTQDTIGKARLLVSTLADPSTYSILAEDSVWRRGDPAHIVRGPADLTTAKYLDVYIQGVPDGNKVAWGNPRVYCRF